MLSIERRFQKIKDNHFFWNSFVCFATAIYGQKLTPTMVNKWFNKLVEKDDYAQNEKIQILRFLDSTLK